MSIAPTAELEELFIVEHIDEEGRYCLVYTDATPDGDEAQCDSLEQAGGGPVGGRVKRGGGSPLAVSGACPPAPWRTRRCPGASARPRSEIRGCPPARYPGSAFCSRQS